MSEHYVTVEVEVKIVTTDEGEAGIDRYIGLPAGNEWQVTPGMTKDDVLRWLARSFIVGGCNDAGQDGFADLDRDSINVYVTDVRES